jgi:hypothetical protein
MNPTGTSSVWKMKHNKRRYESSKKIFQTIMRKKRKELGADGGLEGKGRKEEKDFNEGPKEERYKHYRVDVFPTKIF